MLANHGDFQAFHFRRHPGIDRLAREKWRGHPGFAMTAEFCAEFDQCAMDPDYDTMPIEAFEPMVRRLFARPPRAAEPVSQAFPASIWRSGNTLPPRAPIAAPPCPLGTRNLAVSGKCFT